MSNLRQAAQQALEALENAYMVNSWAWVEQKEHVITALRAALAEPQCMCREPWALERVHREKTPCFDYVERKPLTDEEMRECAQAMNAEPLAEGWPELIKFARAIERAHGIGEQDGS